MMGESIKTENSDKLGLEAILIVNTSTFPLMSNSWNTFDCPLMISISKGLCWTGLFLINMTYWKSMHDQLACAN